MKKKNWTGERLETFIYSRDTIDHLHRYAVAKDYVKDKIVLDIASGEGYGSFILSNSAKFVYGVDIDSDTVEAAKKKYIKENLEFRNGSTSNIPLEDNSVDIVVSFETIEHHNEHDEMFSEIRRVLKPGGVLIISTPDKLYYSDKRNFNNEFHVKELYKDEFFGLIAKNFGNHQFLTQHYCNANSILIEETNSADVKFITGDYFGVNNTEVFPLYLIAIASENSFEKQKLSIFDGSRISSKILDSEIKSVYNSRTFKTGRVVLLPMHILKKIYKKCLQ